jgi:plasmid replication initiation protein
MDKEKFDEIQKERFYKVVKHNDLIQNTRYTLTEQEQQIILYLISKIKPEDKEFKEYKFNIQNFCLVCGIDETSGKNYENLKQTILNIANKSFFININGEDVLMNWIEGAKMNPQSGIVKIRFDNNMKPYLLELKNRFTSYDLYYTLAMKSKYSLRLYEILKSYEYLRECTFTLEILKKRLDAEKYINYKDFRIRVLERAVQEINDYGDISVIYFPQKVGRKVEKITFHIKSKKDALERVKTYQRIENELNK